MPHCLFLAITRLSLKADASAPMLSKVDWASGAFRSLPTPPTIPLTPPPSSCNQRTLSTLQGRQSFPHRLQKDHHICNIVMCLHNVLAQPSHFKFYNPWRRVVVGSQWWVGFQLTLLILQSILKFYLTLLVNINVE